MKNKDKHKCKRILGYIVCRHVMSGAPTFIVRRAKPGNPGDVLCVIPPWDHEVEDLAYVCAGCVVSAGWDKEKPHAF